MKQETVIKYIPLMIQIGSVVIAVINGLLFLQMQPLAERVERMEKVIEAVNTSQSRLSVLETKAQGTDDSLIDLKKSNERIEDKLDRLIERGTR